MWGCCFAENQIAKCSGGESLRVNTALATQGHRLQKRRLWRIFMVPTTFLNGVPFKKI